MSILNQMLKDLDTRRAGADVRVRNEIRSLPPLPARRGRWWLAAGLVVVALAAGASLWPRQDPALPPLVTVIADPVRSPPPTPVAATPAEPTLPKTPERSPRPAKSASEPALRVSTGLARPPVGAAVVAAAALEAAPKAGAAPTLIDKQVRDGGARERADRLHRAAIAASNQGRAGEALGLAQSAVLEDPGHLGARQLAVRLLLDSRDWESLRAVVEDGLGRFPEQIDWALLLGRLQIEKGDADGALKTLERADRYGAQRADFHGGVGAVLHKLGRFAEAEQRYLKAGSLDPGNGRWWFGLGLALEAQGKAGDAREAYARAAQTRGLSADLQAFVDQKLR